MPAILDFLEMYYIDPPNGKSNCKWQAIKPGAIIKNDP